MRPITRLDVACCYGAAAILLTAAAFIFHLFF